MKKYRSKRGLTVLLILLSTVLKITAQQLTPYVISTSGGFYNNSNSMLSFTAGEMSAIETYTTPSNFLTQGFQQVWPIGTAVQENQHFPVSFNIYPNPADNYFNLEMKSDWIGHVEMKIIDILGRQMLHSSFKKNTTIHVQPFDVGLFPPGLYLIHISGEDKPSSTRAYYFIGKIQIVR